MREAVAPIRRLEEVRLTVDLTSAMQREVERGLSNNEERWELEGPCLAPQLKDFCDVSSILSTCCRIAPHDGLDSFFFQYYRLSTNP